jgi:rhomboid protease GluP
LSLIAQGDGAVSGGASGAIFGVYGAFMVYLWRQRRQINPSEFKWFFGGAIGFSVITIVLGLQITGIDNAAHIGGLIGGMLAGAALLHPFDVNANANANGNGNGNNNGNNNGNSGKFSRRIAAGILFGGLVLLIFNIPAPAYRWSEEVLARSEINEFIGEDARISARWGAILNRAREDAASFDELAGRIETEVSSPYAQSFEQLSRLHLSPAAPSAATLESLRAYAELRRDASRALVEGLRAKDMDQVRGALQMATQWAVQGAVLEEKPGEKQGEKPGNTNASGSSSNSSGDGL